MIPRFEIFQKSKERRNLKSWSILTVLEECAGNVYRLVWNYQQQMPVYSKVFKNRKKTEKF